MKIKLLTALTVLLAILGVYCGWRYYQDAWLPNRLVNDALAAQNELISQLRPEILRSDSEVEPLTGDESEEKVDHLAELKAFNPDTVGWLTIPDTTVDYPIVQAGDNQFYLKTGYDRQYSYVGCPFLDSRCAEGFEGFNAIVYAHHIKHEMFGDIAKFSDIDYMRERPSGTLLTEDGQHNVQFFAYLTVPSTSKVYDTGIVNKTDRDGYIDSLFDLASYTVGQTAESLKRRDDLRLLLLSTCTYEFENARGVLVGVIQ